ncbi:MAG: trypsin-like peptidase domain-containing protein [Spirochaetales bacterium]|nr:trypsin-like peptidase domain-containing protein [Spirochaetales bacterium]
MRLFLTTLILLFFVSCVTTEQPKADYPSLEELIRDDVEDLISKKEYLLALQDIFALKEKNNILNPGEMADMEQRLADELKADFFSRIENKDFSQAMSLLETFRVLGWLDRLQPWDKKSLLENWANYELEKNNKMQAFLLYQSLVEAYELTPEELKGIFELSLELNQPLAAKMIMEKSAFQEEVVKSETLAALSEVLAKATLVNGTVTVWVDRGIRLENGYGVPDRGIGSGFFIDKRGYLLTNHHVISTEVDPEYEGFSRLYIRLSEDVKDKIPAKVVGYDRILDLALLKVELEPEYIFPLPVAISFNLGEKVQAIGAPLGLENTLTQGILSNVSPRFIQMGNVVQVDAPINNGNSGGPLLDSRGHLLGVVFAGLEMFEGLNFAIPYNYVKKILFKLYMGGEIAHGFLGMAIDESPKGLEVVYVLPSSSSYRAGIEKQDKLLRINGLSFSKIPDLQEYLLDVPVNALVELVIQREGRELKKYVQLKKRPFSPVEEGLKIDKRENLFVPLFGMEVSEVSNFLWQTNFKVDRVLRGSVADNSGISQGDPMSIQSWSINDEYRAAILQMFIKKRKAGYYDSILQIVSYLETSNFI